MSRYFVTDAPVAVPEFDTSTVISTTPPNVIYIRARMDYATRAKVSSEMFKLGKDSELEAQLGANDMALLIHNIVKWTGPDFDGVLCTADNIRTMDPNEPHMAKVLEEIAKRNKRRESPNARSATSNISESAGAADLNPSAQASPQAGDQSANGISISPLQNAINGRMNKSDDLTLITSKNS